MLTAEKAGKVGDRLTEDTRSNACDIYQLPDRQTNKQTKLREN